FEDFQATIARVYDQNKNVIGTGFLVAPQYLLTCAHVVIQALGLKTIDFPQQTLKVDFPGRTGSLKATVTLWRPCLSYFETRLANVKPGEDIALLKLELKLEGLKLIPIPKNLETIHNLVFNIWGFPEKDGKETN
ncbi:MAG: trypsin-like peptidase domain-containing protein, partial [Microcystaceae cyanobacterium]